MTLGHPRILQLLEQLQIHTTFFAEGYSAVLHPAQMKRWAELGHEIAFHGWKHEMWSNLTSQEREEELVALAVSSLRDLLGRGPLGFRPPGLKINPWTDEVLRKHGIQYVSQALEREQGYEDKFGPIGIQYTKQSNPIVVSTLKVLDTSDKLIDAIMVSPAFGGFFGSVDAITAYDLAYDLAVQHERTSPQKPWVYVVHPFVSGNRAWAGFERFMRRLHMEFGPAAFKTAGAALDCV
jgi:peptidoglycan/xylan/chitin deacetylase (PgdA/CDA1 family)